MGLDEIQHHCVLEIERPMVLDEYHARVERGHYVGKETTIFFTGMIMVDYTPFKCT